MVRYIKYGLRKTLEINLTANKMWAIYVDDTPFVRGDNLEDLERTCAELNLALDYKFTIRKWAKNV